MYYVLILIVVSLLIAGIIYGAGKDRVDRHTVREFDLARYMGDWYEIARFDHSFERNLVEVRATYKALPNERIDVLNSGRDLRTGRRRTAHGKAYTCPVTGRLKVSFFWFFYSEYNVMELGDEYEWALVGSRSSKYLWILSRTPQLPAPTIGRILHLAERRGYCSEKLLFIDQPGAQNR